MDIDEGYHESPGDPPLYCGLAGNNGGSSSKKRLAKQRQKQKEKEQEKGKVKEDE